LQALDVTAWLSSEAVPPKKTMSQARWLSSNNFERSASSRRVRCGATPGALPGESGTMNNGSEQKNPNDKEKKQVIFVPVKSQEQLRVSAATILLSRL
jgi:hypothetical protein